MKNYKKILGYSILSLFFIGLYLILALTIGFIPTSIIFLVSILCTLVVVGAIYLIVS
jgi:hypothetical protein